MRPDLPFADKLLEIYVFVDDFMKYFEPWWQTKLLNSGKKRRNRKTRLSLSEIMTIYICFGYSGQTNFKRYYDFLRTYHRNDFQYLDYNRYIFLIKRLLVPLTCLMQALKGEPTQINFIDSTPMSVSKLSRKNRHKVFAGIAGIGRTSVAWFYGLKLHTIFNSKGELVSLCITPGNVNDKVPVKDLCKGFIGKLFGDKGYISKDLFKELFEGGVQLITTIKKNMKNKLMDIYDKIALKSRKIIETIFSVLKADMNFEHSRHRCPHNAMCHILAYVIAYQLNDNKPSLPTFTPLSTNP